MISASLQTSCQPLPWCRRDGADFPSFIFWSAAGKGKQDSTRASLKSGRKSREGSSPGTDGAPRPEGLIISYFCSQGMLHTHAPMHTLSCTLRTCRHIQAHVEGQISRQTWGHRGTFFATHGRAGGPVTCNRRKHPFWSQTICKKMLRRGGTGIPPYTQSSLADPSCCLSCGGAGPGAP